MLRREFLQNAAIAAADAIITKGKPLEKEIAGDLPPELPPYLRSPRGTCQASISEDGHYRWTDLLADIDAKDLIFNAPGNRSPENLITVVERLNVTDPANKRYQRLGEKTFCNIFVGDATRALFPTKPDAALTHWRDKREWSANEYYSWLKSLNGVMAGWRTINESEARDFANQGIPVVGAYENEAGPGHMFLVLPTPDGFEHPAIAEAGVENSVGRESTYSQSEYFANTADVPQLMFRRRRRALQK